MPPKPKPKAAPRVPTPGRSGIPRRTLVIALAVGAVVAIVAIVLSLVLSGGNSKHASTTPVVNADISAVTGIPQHGLVLGNTLARTTLTEFLDTSCPICRNFTLETFPALSQEYIRTGKTKIEAQPLAFVGPSSERGRALVLAAAMQNKAWQLLELIYHNQGDETQDWLTDDVVRALAAKIAGLDVEKLLADADSQAVADQAAQIDADAQADGINGTPTFVLTTPDGKRHLLGSGNPGIDPFRTALDKALAG